MERNDSVRTAIEDRIISKASDLEGKEGERDPINLDKLEEFMNECRELVQYYRNYTDTVIGVEIVRVYADLTRYFRILKSNTDNPTLHENSQAWLSELENWIDRIITEAAKNWEHLHPDT